MEGLPEQTTVGLATALTVGKGFTVTATVEEPVHPVAVPLTVYVVVTTGLTEAEAVFTLPALALQV